MSEVIGFVKWGQNTIVLSIYFVRGTNLTNHCSSTNRFRFAVSTALRTEPPLFSLHVRNARAHNIQFDFLTSVKTMRFALSRSGAHFTHTAHGIHVHCKCTRRIPSKRVFNEHTDSAHARIC